MAKALKGVHQYYELKEESVRFRVQKMTELRDLMATKVQDMHVKLSYGNRKTTALVPSVSTIPVADCGNCKLCSRGCYDVKHVCCYKETQRMRANNSAILKYDRERYFAEIRMQVHFLRFFRWHVGGDIKDMDYLERVVDIARKEPDCEFLLFTKMYTIVARFLDKFSSFPKNLHVLLSGWRGDEIYNPYNLPISTPEWQDGSISNAATKAWYVCGGDCSACAECRGGCWNAKSGDTIIFEAH